MSLSGEGMDDKNDYQIIFVSCRRKEELREGKGAWVCEMESEVQYQGEYKFMSSRLL